LGTGKTATAVITTEGLSHMRINTLLPKSLKDNFINEIKKFGGDSYDINNSNWVFYDIHEINSKTKIGDFIFKESGLDESIFEKIYKETSNIIKSEIEDSFKDSRY